MEATLLLHARSVPGILVPVNTMESTGAMGTVHGELADAPTKKKVHSKLFDS